MQLHAYCGTYRMAGKLLYAIVVFYWFLCQSEVRQSLHYVYLLHV